MPTAPRPPDDTAGMPTVAVVIPVLNEERHLSEAVGAALGQEYAGPVRVVLAVGPSRDRTDEIAADLEACDARVSTVPNPTGRTADGLNAAIAASDSDVVVRVDGHGILAPDYISTAVRLLEETGAANVGGLMDAEGATSFERAVAAAMTSKLGVGASRFHTGGKPGPADTVYLGVFRREWLERMGGYDRRFVRAQDWELNHRIREAGGLVWFSPELRVAYRPRPTLGTLARQYRDYGRWRRVVSRTHAGTINLRYLAPPLALGAIVVSLAGSVLSPWLLLVPAAYLTATAVGGLNIRDRRLQPVDRLWLPLVLPTMHMAWGWGFLTSRVSIEPQPSSAVRTTRPPEPA